MENIKKDVEKQIVEEVLDDFKNRQEQRKNVETGWQLNINFLTGNQYCFINNANEIVTEHKQYFWQEREVFNHIAPIVELRVAKLSRIRPTLTVLPFSDDSSDVACAKVSRNLLKSVSYDLNLSKLVSEATSWSEICGTSFYKIGWNGHKGRLLGKNELGQDVHEGEVEISVVSPFEIYPDNQNVSRIEDLKSLIHAKSYSVEEIYNMYGVEVEGKKIETISISNINNIGGLGYTATTRGFSKINNENQALVIEKYDRPSAEYPDGRLTIIAGDKLVYMGELPYINGIDGERGIPFIKQNSINIPNSFWGSSIIERLIPVQRAFNTVKNRKHEFMNRLSLGVLAVEDGSIDIEDLEEEGLSPGKILVYRQGSNAPKMMSNESVPDCFEKEEESLKDEFLNISGVGDLLTSMSVQSGQISGVALQLLIEHDEHRMASTEDEIKRSIKEIGKQILRLYKQFAVLPHNSRLVNDNGEIEMFYWNNAQINSEDVVFETENELSQTVAQRRSMLMDILNMGLLSDENGVLHNSTRQKVLEQFGFGIWDNEQDIKNLQAKRAEKENFALLTENELKYPTEIDDHEIHIARHIAFMLGKDFEKSGTEELSKKLLNHIKEHKQFLNKEEE